MSQAISVSTDTFDQEVSESNLPVVVDFYADWCAPCRVLGPILDRVSDTYSGRAKIVKVNIDHEPELAARFQVSSIPTLAFVIHGRVVGQSAGLPSERELKAVVQQLIDFN